MPLCPAGAPSSGCAGASVAKGYKGSQFRLAVDTNGTIIEGDSMHDEAPKKQLAEPVYRLLAAVQHEPVMVVFFTFGSDYELATEASAHFRQHVKLAHMFFIARCRDAVGRAILARSTSIGIRTRRTPPSSRRK
mmetsp:Transcript_70830/g.229690  ORF Transcript_70830/g.229690 Transcript_70830/m.229690 type:complete len:134 (+) Transcript_70830:121-522(+)